MKISCFLIGHTPTINWVLPSEEMREKYREVGMIGFLKPDGFYCVHCNKNLGQTCPPRSRWRELIIMGVPLIMWLIIGGFFFHGK